MVKDMQYTKKSFTSMGDGDDVRLSVMSDEDRNRLSNERFDSNLKDVIEVANKKHVKRNIVPFGDRILVRRRKIGGALGQAKIIIAADETSERPTDLADVVCVAEYSFADVELLGSAEEIVKSLTDKAKSGDSEALLALMKFREYLNIKAIKVGDAVFISKYVGTDFHDNAGSGNLTLLDGSDVIGLVVSNE